MAARWHSGAAWIGGAWRAGAEAEVAATGRAGRGRRGSGEQGEDAPARTAAARRGGDAWTVAARHGIAQCGGGGARCDGGERGDAWRRGARRRASSSTAVGVARKNWAA